MYSGCPYNCTHWTLEEQEREIGRCVKYYCICTSYCDLYIFQVFDEYQELQDYASIEAVQLIINNADEACNWLDLFRQVMKEDNLPIWCQELTLIHQILFQDLIQSICAIK